MTNSERLSCLDFKIHKFDHQKCFTVMKTSSVTKKIISYKYNTHVKSKI
jgi:hypothetical protein